MWWFLNFVAVFAITGQVKSFDYGDFQEKYCYEDTNVRRTGYYIPYSSLSLYTGALVCENFVLTTADLDYMARTSYSFKTNFDAVIFKNCQIDYLNEYLASKFPLLDEMYFENCNISLKNPNIFASQTVRALNYFGFYKCNIYDNLKSLAFQNFGHRLSFFFMKDSVLEYPIIDEYLLPKTISSYEFLIDNVNVKRFEKNWLSSSRDLGSISCASCQLEDLDSMFENLGRAVAGKFIFNDNLIRKLPSSLDIFAKYNFLQEINLSGNVITEPVLKRIHFKSLQSLTTLDLSRNTNINKISYLTFKDVISLQKLNLSNVNLEFLDQLGGANFSVIDFSENKISTVPAETFLDLNILVFLNLSSNQITSLETSVFRNLRSLVELRLNSNNLSGLPADIFNNLKALEILDLSSNSLEVIDTFESLSNLRQLYLQNNLLKVIPSSQSLPHSLRILDISGNHLNFIGRNTFENLGQLTSLDISYTNSSYLDFDKYCLQPLPNLKILRIRGNKMTSIEDIFLPTSLEELDLEFNKLPVVTNKGLEDLTYLKYLNLSHNYLHSVEKDLMRKLSKIRIVDLSGNEI